MTKMRRASLVLAACLALAMGAIACASPPPVADATQSESPDTTDPPATVNPDSTDPPATVNPDGTVTVTTRHRTMVIEDGDGPPQLCVGGVQESLPPNCSGVELVGWNWGAVGSAYDEQGTTSGDESERGHVRWGEFTVTGNYSRENDRLTVLSVEPGGAEPEQLEVCPDGSPTLAPHERPVFDEGASHFVAERFGISVPVGYSDECGRLTIGVAYDDGSIQAAFDEMGGEGPRTRVEAALVPMGAEPAPGHIAEPRGFSDPALPPRSAPQAHEECYSVREALLPVAEEYGWFVQGPCAVDDEARKITIAPSRTCSWTNPKPVPGEEFTAAIREARQAVEPLDLSGFDVEIVGTDPFAEVC